MLISELGGNEHGMRCYATDQEITRDGDASHATMCGRPAVAASIMDMQYIPFQVVIPLCGVHEALVYAVAKTQG